MATETIDTADLADRSLDRSPAIDRPDYVGRFAPSPTGSLHLGSLVAALGSYLDARRAGGRWLVRMEDLDAPRVVPGAADDILRTLESLGLDWDGPVLRQSQRLDVYDDALNRLRDADLLFECSCARTGDAPYPGTCRSGPRRSGPTATRFRMSTETANHFHDRFQGDVPISAAGASDVVVRRRDGLPAYQLAVVVDDIDQGVTDVVRGSDLVDSTAWQLAVRAALHGPPVTHAHIPLVVEPGGAKLAKSRRSVSIHGLKPGEALIQGLRLLRQEVAVEAGRLPPPEILKMAVASWEPRRLAGVREVRLVE